MQGGGNGRSKAMKVAPALFQRLPVPEPDSKQAILKLSEAEAAFGGFMASPTRSHPPTLQTPWSTRRSLQIEAGDVQNPRIYPPFSQLSEERGDCSPNPAPRISRLSIPETSRTSPKLFSEL